MSPERQGRSGGREAASSSLYTAILALAFGAVVIVAAFVAYVCYYQYGTIFKIP
jgi:uncharacterized membrane protein